MAAFRGDIMGLMKVLDPETVWHSDGGGIVRAGARPIYGVDKVARLLVGLVENFVEPGTTSALVELDGEPGLAVHGPDGVPIAVFGFSVDDSGLITATHVVVIPRKLTRVPSAGV